MRITKLSLSLIIALLVGCSSLDVSVPEPHGYKTCGDVCKPKPVAEKIGMTREKIFALAKQRHVYIGDYSQYKSMDRWVPSLIGDCEDFALYVRNALRKNGHDADIATVYINGRDAHAVVIAPDGSVFDNRLPLIVNKNDLKSYRWASYQRGSEWFDY